MSGTPIIRRPSVGDAEKLAATHVRAWRETYAGLMPEAFLQSLAVEPRVMHWRSDAEDPQSIIFAAFDGDEAVGLAIAGQARRIPAAEGRGEIYAIYLLQSHQRRGLGRGLMAAMSGAWMRRGGTSLALWAVSRNTKARAFYEALGGVPGVTGTYDGPGFRLEETSYLFSDLARIAG